jgi:hypothetical protein
MRTGVVWDAEEDVDVVEEECPAADAAAATGRGVMYCSMLEGKD